MESKPSYAYTSGGGGGSRNTGGGGGGLDMNSSYPLLQHHYGSNSVPHPHTQALSSSSNSNSSSNMMKRYSNEGPGAYSLYGGGYGLNANGYLGGHADQGQRNGEGSRRQSPSPAQPPSRPTTTPYPYPLANPALSTQFDLIPSANSTPDTTPAPSGTGSEDADADGDHEHDHEEGSGNPTKSGRAGNRRRQKYSRTRTGCLSCRTRRIKCDEGRPVCKRCIIAKKTCHWPTAEEEASGKKKKERSKRNRSSEGRSASDEERKTKSRISSTNDLGLYNYPNQQYAPNGSLNSSSFAPDSAVSMPQLPDIPAGDFTWDQSHVGSYDPSAAATFVSLLNGTGGGNGSADNSAAPSPANGNDNAGDLQSGMAASADLLGGIMEQKKWGQQGGAPMFNTPNFLLPWFPTAEERSLILHYCANAADLMMAIPSGLNPMLAINLPLALDSPRGVNPSADALRVALLGIGAVHQAFLLARSGVSTQQTATMFQYASTLRDSGKEMVRRAAADGTGAGSDAALGASTALATIDIFFGGSGWMDNFKLAKEMIAYRGGPAEMLKVSKPRQLADGVTMSPARLMLEILAIYETFGCLTTGQEPSLISDKWESWWFEGGRSSYEEHSVEKQFGMSRVMVHLFSRLTRLIARCARFTKSIPEAGTPPPSLDPREAESTSSREPTREVIYEARALRDDVDAWIESLQLATLEHERVQVGNRAYAYAMKILLLRMVFGYTRDHNKVQDAALQVLTHCSTSTALLGMSIDLTWPAIIAGCCVDGTERRQWLMTLLEGFKAQCCFDIETATTIIVEVWRRVDAGEGRADWKPVCEDLGLKVLLC